MNIKLNARKPIVLSLVALTFLVAATLLLINAFTTARVYSVREGISPQIASLSLNDLPSASRGDFLQPKPRVKFAALEGRRPPPAALEGRKLPPAALEGRKLPPAALEGRKLPPAALEGRKLPPAALGGWRTPAGQTAPISQPAISFTLADGLVLLALAALLVAPTRKVNPTTN